MNTIFELEYEYDNIYKKKKKGKDEEKLCKSNIQFNYSLGSLC